MATNVGDDEFDEYDKPGAERSRRRRGEDDDLESDLEEDLLEEDWLSSKKNPSELSDEELNDDLLQSDEEEQNASGQADALSLNATLGLGTSGHLNDENPEGGEYIENTYDETEGFPQDGAYEEEHYQGEDEAVEYPGEQNYEGYQDEVLDLQIDEPLDDDFQVDEYPMEYTEEQNEQQKLEEEEEECEEDTEEHDEAPVTEEGETENDPEAEGEPEQETDVKEESDEEEEDDEESGRQRFKTERKDATVVRLSDATSKRRNIPETLELSEEAKADLQEFEEKERQRKQGRFGGRGRGGPRADGGRGGMAGRGGVRGRGGGGRGGRGDFAPFGMGDFRGDGGRGRIHEQRPPLMQVNLGLQQQLRMTPQLQHHHHHQSRMPSPRGSGGPGLFPDPGGPIPQQPLQLLMPHLSQRSPGPSSRAQHESHGPRLMSSPPRHAHLSQHQQHQQHQPKNIHINPHFRGPSSSPVQVPSMPPVQNQQRPNIAPQRLPAPEFQPHLQGNFGPPQRPLPLQEQWRGPPPLHQDRERFIPGEPRFPGQHMFDQPGPTPLLNTNLLPMPGQGPLSFPPQGGLGGPGFGPLGLGQNQGPLGGGVFQRDPPRPGLAPQHAGPPGPPGPRGFVSHRQPFSPQQQGPPFSPQHMPFGMQGLMQQHSQPLHHDPPLSHQPLHQQQPQQHRQDFPPQGLPHSQLPPQHQQHHQHHSRDQHPIMHLSTPHFRQPVQSGHRPMQPRPQGTQQRNNHPRPRMTSPSPLQQMPPQRNSNLRELPIATGNNNIQPLLPGGPAKPVIRATHSAGQGLAGRAGPAGRGGLVAQGQNTIKVQQQPSAPEMKKELPAAQSSTPEDPDEDEETRQYRLKIEEQKRLREEILKRKEQRRQMQAGKRKKELMERISGQNQNQTPQTQNPTQPPATQPSATQPPQPVPSLISNGTTENLSSGPGPARLNVKARLQNTKPQAQASGWSGPQKQQNTNPDSNQQGQWQPPQKRTITPQIAQRQGAVQGGPAEGHGLPQPQPQPGGKRTVMQRANSTESPQVPQKVRLVKLLGQQAAAGPNTGPPPQQQQPIGRPAPQQRLGPIRKVTMATGGAQNQQQTGRGMANQMNRVVVRGRGRGGGRMMIQQNQRAQNPQPSTVCIEGLSTTTTSKQLMNLLNSIGQVETFTMLPEQRKAIAKFVNPQHAASFQHSFHRHMIDLSHIDVSIIDG